MSEGGFQVPIALVPRSHGTSILINSAVFLGLAWVTVGLRFYTRVRIVRAIGWDDGSMLVTTVRSHTFSLCLDRALIRSIAIFYSIDGLCADINVLD